MWDPYTELWRVGYILQSIKVGDTTDKLACQLQLFLGMYSGFRENCWYLNILPFWLFILHIQAKITLSVKIT